MQQKEKLKLDLNEEIIRIKKWYLQENNLNFSIDNTLNTNTSAQFWKNYFYNYNYNYNCNFTITITNSEFERVLLQTILISELKINLGKTFMLNFFISSPN